MYPLKTYFLLLNPWSDGPATDGAGGMDRGSLGFKSAKGGQYLQSSFPQCDFPFRSKNWRCLWVLILFKALGTLDQYLPFYKKPDLPCFFLSTGIVLTRTCGQITFFITINNNIRNIKKYSKNNRLLYYPISNVPSMRVTYIYIKN